MTHIVDEYVFGYHVDKRAQHKEVGTRLQSQLAQLHQAEGVSTISFAEG